MLDQQHISSLTSGEIIRKKFKAKSKELQNSQIITTEYSNVSIPPGTDLNVPVLNQIVKAKIPDQLRKSEKPVNYLALLKSCIVNITDHYDIPPACIEILQSGDNITLGTLGNFSTIIGKAKSRKTYGLSLILAAAIRSGNLPPMTPIRVNQPSKQRAVILCDTEQSVFKIHQVVKRIHKLAGVELCNNFTAYGLRGQSTEDRLALIEHAIYNTPNLGLVIIDGIRDLVRSINEEDQATMITSKLLKWTEDKNIHIIVVLHQNKNDVNARGHVGTELTNKSETVLSISRDSKDDTISVIEGLYCRDREFESCAFKIDYEGMLYFIDDWQNYSTTIRNKPVPSEISSETHMKILRAVFMTSNSLQLSELNTALKMVCKEQGYDFGNNKIGGIRQYYQDQGWIKCEKVQGKRYSMYTYTPSL